MGGSSVETSFKARQMVPGKDTLSVMAMHYGLKPSTVRDIIKSANVPVIREDGFKGEIIMVSYAPGKRKVLGWSDGQVGIDPDKTKLTKPAIMAVAHWKFLQSENDGDN
jgi:hypothetical protein